MCLRKSPTRTAASIAANRANARKSTGPRTEQGKARSALNGVKHGQYSPDLLATLERAGRREAEEFAGIHRAVLLAVAPAADDRKGQALVKRVAAFAWAIKHRVDGMLANPERWKTLFDRRPKGVPRPWRMRFRCPGGHFVTVSVSIRRAKGWDRTTPKKYPGKVRGRKLYAVASVTSSMRHPKLGFQSLRELPPGVAPRVCFTAKPEGDRKQAASQNAITATDWDRVDAARDLPVAAGGAPAEAPKPPGGAAESRVGQPILTLKPESYGEEGVSQNAITATDWDQALRQPQNRTPPAPVTPELHGSTSPALSRDS